MREKKDTFAKFAASNEAAYRLYIREDKKLDNPRHHLKYKFKSEFSIDVDKIIYCPLYNRYSDKTQVFSLRNNDNLTRRATHVQLVARIANVIGSELGLNTDLIQAIALGHDIGHTPFGHAGENYLDQLYYGYTKRQTKTPRHFFHNVHSVRALMKIARANLTVQTYDGILFHNGEKLTVEEDNGVCKLRPAKKIPKSENNEEPEELTLNAWNWNIERYWERYWEKYGKVFEDYLNDCTIDEDSFKHRSASTLEGCVVRISDMLAYLYKDRQDAIAANYWQIQGEDKSKCRFDEFIVKPQRLEGGRFIDIDENGFDIIPYEDSDEDKNSNEDNKSSEYKKNKVNYETIPKFIEDIIETSGIDEHGVFLGMSKKNYENLEKIKEKNSNNMYIPIDEEIEPFIKPVFMAVYAQMREDFIIGMKKRCYDSPIFKHRVYPYTQWKIDGSFESKYTTKGKFEGVDEAVVDYIASMTDDYIIDLYGYLLKHRVGDKFVYNKCEKGREKSVDIAKNCLINTKLEIKFMRDGSEKKYILPNTVIECELLWDEELYRTIKDYYALSYFKEERQEQIKNLQNALDDNATITKYMYVIEKAREEKLGEICKKEKLLKEIADDTGLKHDEIKEKIAIALHNDYKFVKFNQENVTPKIAEITGLDVNTVKKLVSK